MKALKVLTILVFAVAVTVGCSKQRERGGDVRTGGRGQVSPTVPGPGGGGGGNGTFQSAYGDIFNYTVPTVKALISATMDPEDPENFRAPVHGIAIAGNIRVQGVSDVRNLSGQTAQIDGSSEFAMFIIDDLAEEKGAITIGFRQGVANASISGQIYNAGVANLVFTDQYGSITLQGQYNASEFTGTVTFQNNNGQSGQLGSFRVPTCGFFHCGN